MKEKSLFNKESLLSCLAFSFFVVCPRMAGMINILHMHSDVSMIKTVLLGMLIAMPILILMVKVFDKFGVMGALIFCICTDFGSALIMKGINISAGIETLVVALFVIAGVKLTPFITKLIYKEKPKSNDIDENNQQSM